MINVLKEMLLIEEPSVFSLYQELIKIANYFIAPVFTISLILEYFGEMNFGASVKKLFLVIIFMGAFYGLHTQGSNIALESASQTLRRVSPTNLFVKKWTQVKVKTKSKKGWDSLKSILIPNINDLLGTAFFLLAKLFIWLLKLIYSSVYHLTYVFAGVTAILYFLGWTKDALKGTIQASLWCMLMPFVIVAILSLVGNSIEDSALNGDLIISKIDTILWLFGVTLLLLISPLITYGMIRGDGIHSFGSKMGAMVVSSGIKAMTFYPMMAKMMSIARDKTVSPLKSIGGNMTNKLLSNKNGNSSLSKLTSNSSKLNKTKTPEVKAKGDSIRSNQSKDTFVYDKKYWKAIAPNHKEGIRQKYGIKAQTPTSNKTYYPIKSEGKSNRIEGQRTIQKLSKNKIERQIKTTSPKKTSVNNFLKKKAGKK